MRDSRPDKLIHISTAEVREQQFSRLTREDERDLESVREQADRRHGKARTHTAEQSLQHALDHVFERISVAKDYEVLSAAAAWTRRSPVQGSCSRRCGTSKPAVKLSAQATTSPPAPSLDRERDTINRVNRGIAQCERLGKDAGSHVSETLNAEQRKVVEFVLDSRDRVVNVQGAAGTGKTATLEELKRGLEAGGRLTVAVAPTMSAAEELQHATFNNAMTLERLLQDKEIHPHLAGRAIILDEAGMVSGRQLHQLLILAERFDARIVLSGDSKQLQSVEASDALRIL